MKVVLAAVIGLVPTLLRADQPGGPVATTRPTTRPASLPTSRPVRANTPLSPPQLMKYRAALLAIQQQGNPAIRAARAKLQESKKQQDAKYEQQQSKDRDEAALAMRRGNLDLRRRRPSQAFNEAQKMQSARSDSASATLRHRENERDYTRAMSELSRLEKAWAACKEYGLDLEYRQWYQADVARANAEATLARRTSTANSAEAIKLIEPIEQSIRDELRKLESQQEVTKP